jgi:uncharacterized membrane protein YhaH (DUF805 family)
MGTPDGGEKSADPVRRAREAQVSKELGVLIKHFERKRGYERNAAFWLKISVVLLASSITVLLGLTLDAQYQPIAKNVALVLSAAIAVINAIEGFFNHRGLWIRRTVTLRRLRDLERDMLFSLAEDTTDLSEQLQQFKDRLQSIMADDMREWLKLRSEQADRPEATGDRAGGPVGR